jgi:hypothetical protein
MEDTSKHSLSILSLPHSVSAHLIECVNDLSSVLVVNSLCFILSSSLGLCACVYCGFVCVASQPYSCAFIVIFCCKGERLQLVEIPRKRGKEIRKKSRGIQVDHWIT